MRKTLRIFFFMVKGVLLLIAVAAVVMWPVSSGRQMVVSVERFTAGPASGESRRYAAACWDGRVVIRRDWRYASVDRQLHWIRGEVESGGEGRRWERW